MAEPHTPKIASTCPYCGVGCGVTAQTLSNGKTVITGDEHHPANAGKLCVKGSRLAETLASAGRLTQASIEGQPVAIDAALDEVAKRITHAINTHGPNSIAFYLSGQLLTEDYYVANKLMKGFIGSANVDTNSRLCMSSAVAAYKRAFGSDTVPVNYSDIDHAEVTVLVGSNAAWTHPILFQRMQRARQQSARKKIIVIDPRASATTAQADLHLAIKPGTDAMLFNGLLGYLARQNKLATEYITQHTEGLEQALQQCPSSLTEVALYCGLPEHQIRQFYDAFAQADTALTCYSMGINQSTSGVDKCNAIINVHLASGKIARTGCGPFSLTGQPNAMGGREVGGLANTLAAHMEFNEADKRTVEQFWQAPNLAQQPGLKAVDLFNEVKQGNIKVLWIMATNPAVSLPDSDHIKAALQQCDCVIVSDCIAHTDTTALANILLPAQAWSEKDGTVTNSERCISRQRAFLPALGDAKPDWWLVCEVAKRLGYHEAFNYQNNHEIFIEHAQLSTANNHGQGAFNLAGLTQLSKAQYDALAPIQWPVLVNPMQQTTATPARPFADGQFCTRTGKAQFIAVMPSAPVLPEATTLMLNTGRSRDQWHTMTRTGLAGKLNAHQLVPQLEMNPNQAQQLGLQAGDLIQLANPQGRYTALVCINESMATGQCFASIHWTDQHTSNSKVNRLLAAHVDPISGQPQYKQSAVQLQKLNPVCWWAVCSEQPIALPQGHLFKQQVNIQHGVFTLVAWPTEQALAALTLSTEHNHTHTTLGLNQPSQNMQRNAWVNEGQFSALALQTATSPIAQLSELVRLFEQRTADAQTQSDFMAIALPTLGPRVCNCLHVYEAQIQQFKTEHPSATVTELMASKQCGTRCGSCIPELQQLMAGQPEPVH